jgi:hypothetical protein
MEIHKPKAVHSWRELLTEIGVVVIGVCIALAAEQTVEWLHWRKQVAEARDVIATELAVNLSGGIIRVGSKACVESRLDQLAQILDEAAIEGSLPPLGDIRLPPRSIWPTGAWDSVVASQTATHFPRQQLADMAGVYKFVQRLESFSGREIDAWTVLFSMTGPGRRLDAASESELRKALSSARYSNRVLASLGQQMADRVKGLHLPFSQGDLASIAAAKRLRVPGQANNPCDPIGPAPAIYGQAAGVALPGDLSALPDFSESSR